MFHGKLGFRWMFRMKFRLRNTPNEVLPCEISSLPDERSSLTSGFGPE